MKTVARKGKVFAGHDSKSGAAARPALYYLNWCLACCVGAALSGLAFTGITKRAGHPEFSRWLTQPVGSPARGSKTGGAQASRSAQFYLNCCAWCCAGMVISARAFAYFTKVTGHPGWSRWLTEPPAPSGRTR